MFQKKYYYIVKKIMNLVTKTQGFGGKAIRIKKYGFRVKTILVLKGRNSEKTILGLKC